jgi:hypothetical protein
MFKSTLSLIAIGIFASVAVAQDAAAQKVGWTGTIAGLDGGLAGTMKVLDTSTIEISNYVLKDASAPALYWWGVPSGSINTGFRISNKQVTETSTGKTLDIKLDAGKTLADFAIVGLWCEHFSINFGQATLKAADGSAGSATASASSTAKTTTGATSSGSMAAATSASSSPGSNVASMNAIIVALGSALGFAAFLG